MKLIKEITQFIIFSQETIINALQKINKSKIIFIVDRSGVVEGTVTDGDFRRWLLKQGEIDLNGSIVTYTPNKDFNGDDSFTYKVSDGINERIAKSVIKELK